MIYTTQRRRFVYDTWDNGSRLDRVMVECTLSITHCFRLNLQLHTIDLVRTCRISSFCTVAWQLARFQFTRHIARSLGDSWASCVKCISCSTGLSKCEPFWHCRKMLLHVPLCPNKLTAYFGLENFSVCFLSTYYFRFRWKIASLITHFSFNYLSVACLGVH